MFLLLLLELVDDGPQPIGVRHLACLTGTSPVFDNALLAAVRPAMRARPRVPLRPADLLVQRHTLLRPERRGRPGREGHVPQAFTPQLELSLPVLSDLARTATARALA
ncbi:hypothetical protein ACFVID_17365 [Streptomyces sp. NPDC127132]|uniref:hypothetical protein n=1 Tax=Streptomyces sp. NPDC127132 TaxID=3345374 RepID=UPI00363CAC76